MPRRSQRLDPAESVGEIVAAVPCTGDLTLSEARDAADGLGGMVLKIPSLKQLEASGLSIAGKGIHVGKGILILCANQSMEVMELARQRLQEIEDPEMFAKVAGVHGQCVGHLQKNAELQMEQRKIEETLPSAKPHLEAIPE